MFFRDTIAYVCILCRGLAKPSPQLALAFYLLTFDVVFNVLSLETWRENCPRSLLLSPKSSSCYLGDCVVTSYLLFRCWWSTELSRASLFQALSPACLDRAVCGGMKDLVMRAHQQHLKCTLRLKQRHWWAVRCSFVFGIKVAKRWKRNLIKVSF